MQNLRQHCNSEIYVAVQHRLSQKQLAINYLCYLSPIFRYLVNLDRLQQTSYEYDDTVEDAELLPLFAWSWIADDKNLPPVANTAVCHQGNRWQ